MNRQPRIMTLRVLRATSLLAAAWLPGVACQAQTAADGGSHQVLAAELQKLDADVLPAERREELSEMLSRELRKRIGVANQTSTQDWRKVATRKDWDSFRREKLAALARTWKN